MSVIAASLEPFTVTLTPISGLFSPSTTVPLTFMPFCCCWSMKAGAAVAGTSGADAIGANITEYNKECLIFIM